MNHKSQFTHPKRLYVIAGASVVIGWMIVSGFQKKHVSQEISEKVLETLNQQQERMKKKKQTFDDKFKKDHEAFLKSSQAFQTYRKEVKADLDRSFKEADERRKRREQEFDEAVERSKKDAIQYFRKNSKEMDKAWEKNKK